MNPARHCAIFWGLLFTLAANAQFVPPDHVAARSVTGQFVVSAGPPTDLMERFPDLENDPELLRLDPPLLAVSAERARDFIWHKTGWNADTAWSGQIFFHLRPAVTLDDPVTIIAHPFVGHWDYRVELPDLISRSALARALAGVILLERANSHALVDSGSVPVPAWLADGFAQDLLGGDNHNLLLTSPNQPMRGPPQAWTIQKQRGVDPLAATRQTLQQADALTFDQLSWPTETQLAGNDDGVYYASAQLFVTGLLDLKDGPAKMQAMLEQLPAYMNWQTAFYKTFGDDFTRPLAVEKWWALQVVSFVAHEPGPRWTLAASREKLDDLMRVSADIRTGSNAVPARMVITLVEAIRQMPLAAQPPLLEARLRDLQMAQVRLALPYVMLAREYSAVLSDYLGEPHRAISTGRQARSSPATIRKLTRPGVLQQLEALDAHRRELARQLKLNFTER